MVLGEERHAVRRSGWREYAGGNGNGNGTGRRAHSVVIDIDLVANVLAEYLLDCSLESWRSYAGSILPL